MANPDWNDTDHLIGRLSREKASSEDDEESTLVDAAHRAAKTCGKPDNQGARSDDEWTNELRNRRRRMFDAVDALLSYREQRHREWWLKRQSSSGED